MTNQRTVGVPQHSTRKEKSGNRIRRYRAVLFAAVALLLAGPPGQVSVVSAGTTLTICIQDDGSANTLSFSVSTGAYTFSNCAGFTVSGTGKVVTDGTVFTLTDVRSDRRLNAWVDMAQKRAKASYQRISPSAMFTIFDRNTANDTCACLRST